MNPEIEMNELVGKSFKCIEYCAMCCLCQPELSDEESNIFMKDPVLSAGLTIEHIGGFRSKKPTAIKLQNGCGGCHFLKDRWCTIYKTRPRFCRQFPLHIHALKRLQMNVNLSCRGISDGGEILLKYARSLMDDSFKKRALTELIEAQKRADEFEKKCKRNGVYQDEIRLTEAGEQTIAILALDDGIGKILTYANSCPEVGKMPVEKVMEEIRSSESLSNIAKMANDTNYEQFILDRTEWLPVYTDERLSWNTFRSNDRAIEWFHLRENGAMSLVNRISHRTIGLIPRTMDAVNVFNEYSRLLVHRDCFKGYAYHVCAKEGYSYDLMVVFLGVLGTTMLDLWWRASLVAKMNGRTEIDEQIAREGIKAFDMDCLDAPTIGIFF